MSLIPDLEAQLLSAARRTQPRTAAAPGGRQRRGPHGRLGLFAVIGVLGLSGGGAYAARHLLWDPPLGNDRAGHAQPTTAPPPLGQLRALGILRRPQTDADRGAASLAALRVMGNRWQGKVRVAYVRRLATLPNGDVAVLVPIDRGPVSDTRPARSPRAELCLWVGQPGNTMPSGGGCASTQTLLHMGIWLSSGVQSARSRGLARQLDAYYALHGRPHAGDRPSRYVSRIQSRQRHEMRNRRAIHVWVVPDGSGRTKLRPNARRAAVRVNENVYTATAQFVGGRFTWVYPPR
jgi:hypothetical protein